MGEWQSKWMFFKWEDGEVKLMRSIIERECWEYLE